MESLFVQFPRNEREGLSVYSWGGGDPPSPPNTKPIWHGLEEKEEEEEEEEGQGR